MTKSVNTYPIEIAFVSPGACPPVYVAGSFTEPPWEPHELQYSIDEQQHALSDGQKKYVFHRTFDLPKGNFQYKFRLGHNGDWWVCDHTVATVIDALGNQNNCLVVAKSASASKKYSYPLSLDSKVDEEDGKRPAKNPIISRTQHALQQCESTTSTAVSSFETSSNTAQIAHPDIKEALKPTFLAIQEDLDYALRSRKGGNSSSAENRPVEAKPSPPVPGGLLHQIIHWLTTILSALFRRKTK